MSRPPNDLRVPAPMQRPVAIVDVTVWSNGNWRSHQDVLLDDGAVHQLRDHVPGATGLDGTGAHLMPGFVNTHTHLQQSTCRGVGEGQPLLAWLLAVGEAMVAVTPERAYVAAVAGALDGLRSGSTALVEHLWPHPSAEVHDAVVQALDDVGVRAVLGRGVADRADGSRRWGFDPRLMQPLDTALSDVERLAALAGPRLTLALAVPNLRSLTPEGMHQVRSFAEQHELPVSMHLLETMTDDVLCREHTGRGAVAHLADCGFLWDRLLAVHGVELDAADRAELARHAVAVSYNPVSNMRLGSGVAPVLELLEAGIDVGLGVDGPGSNDRQDMLETMRAGAYLQRAVRRDAAVLNASEMLRLAIDGASRTLGLPGRPDGVVPGVRADLTLLRFDRDLGCLPVTDASASLLTTGSPRIVDTVLVDGEVVLADGCSTRIDESRLIRALQALSG